jgi:hypothetical protein
MEGTPDHHEPSTFTSRRSRWSWRLPHTSKARAPPKETGEPTRRRRPSSRGWKRERRQGCQRYGRTRAPWEENAHAPAITQAKHKPGRREALEAALQRQTGPVDPPKRFGRRESARASGQAASSPDSVGRPRGETRGSERRKQTRWRVHASSVRVAEVDRTHRASCPPGGCKTSWRSRQGASQKEARSHRLTRDTSGDKANRCARPSKR